MYLVWIFARSLYIMTKILLVFLIPSRWKQGHYLERVHDRFLPFYIVSKISFINLPTIYSTQCVLLTESLYICKWIKGTYLHQREPEQRGRAATFLKNCWLSSWSVNSLLLWKLEAYHHIYKCLPLDILHWSCPLELFQIANVMFACWWSGHVTECGHIHNIFCSLHYAVFYNGELVDPWLNRTEALTLINCMQLLIDYVHKSLFPHHTVWGHALL